jgi:hypothetical protein
LQVGLNDQRSHKNNQNLVNPPRLPQVTALLLSACALLLLALPSARAAEGNEDITAVSASASKDYVRTKLPDGSFRPEGYAFAKGGQWKGTISDETMDKLGFLDIARIIAVPLATQNYLPEKDPNKTKLMIMVYWGTTDVPGPVSTSDGYQNYQTSIQQYNGLLKTDPNMARSVLSSGLIQLSIENAQRDRLDAENAKMLGYDSEGLIGTEYGQMIDKTALKGHRDDLIAEIEDNRYFVVLMAYDFQMLWKQKKNKLLWETRFSIRERGNDFGKILPAVAQYASQYFGQDSKGLVRQPLPEGHVEVGEPRSLGAVPEK